LKKEVGEYKIMVKLDKYINLIPLEIRNMFKTLADENRQAIIMYLFVKGYTPLNKIAKELDMAKGDLKKHLSVLMRYGLLYNSFSKNKFDDRYSHYEVSKLGKKVLNSLLDQEVLNGILDKVICSKCKRKVLQLGDEGLCILCVCEECKYDMYCRGQIHGSWLSCLREEGRKRNILYIEKKIKSEQKINT
jgi:DNA-binding MarR family transcriptional regulator